MRHGSLFRPAMCRALRVLDLLLANPRCQRPVTDSLGQRPSPGHSGLSTRAGFSCGFSCRAPTQLQSPGPAPGAGQSRPVFGVRRSLGLFTRPIMFQEAGHTAGAGGKRVAPGVPWPRGPRPEIPPQTALHILVGATAAQPRAVGVEPRPASCRKGRRAHGQVAFVRRRERCVASPSPVWSRFVHLW